MSKIFKVLSASVLTASLSLPLVAHAASPIADGNLIYDGGQTDTKVYSDIHATSKGKGKYMVQAIVKRGSSTYSTKFKADKAYKSIDRVWYANEKSGYDYYKK